MQKNIFICVFALIVFIPCISGEALDLVYEVKIDNSIIVKSDSSIITQIDGYVYDENSEKIVNALNGQYLFDPQTGLSVEIQGGYFITSVLTSTPGKYTLELQLSDLVKSTEGTYYLDLNGDDINNSDDYIIIPPTYTVLPKIELDDTLEFTCSQNGFVAVSGKIVNMAGQDVGIRYVGEQYLKTYQIRDDGSFGFALNNRTDLDHGGELELVLEIKDTSDEGTTINETESAIIATGIVHHLPLSVNSSHQAFARGTLNRNISISVSDLPDNLYSGSSVNSDYRIQTKLYDEDNEELTAVDGIQVLLSSGVSRSLQYSPLNYKALNKLSIGTYMVEVVVKRITENGIAVDKEIYKHIFELSVLKAQGSLFIGDELFVNQECGTFIFDLGGQDEETTVDDILYFKDGQAIKSAGDTNALVGGYVLKYYAPGEEQKIVHSLFTDSDTSTVYPQSLPAGISKTQFLGYGNTIASIPLYQGGIFRYTLEAYVIEGSFYTLLFSKNGQFNVEGYSVNVANKKIYSGQTTEQTIIVKDALGNPINNAIIYYGENIYGVNNPVQKKAMSYGLDENGIYNGKKGWLFVDAANTNIANGVYTVEDWQVEGGGYLNIIVYRVNSDKTVTRMAVIENAIKLESNSSWQVQLSTTETLPGEEKEYLLTVTDENGYIVSPDAIDILEDGLGWRTINSIEINANTTPEGIRIIHTCRNETLETLVFQPRNSTGSITGEATVNVIRPQIVFENNRVPIITEDFITPLVFTIVDPREAEPIDTDIRYELANVGTGAYGGLYATAYCNTGELEVIDGDDEYKLFALISNLNDTEIAQAKVTPILKLYLISDDPNGDIHLADILIKKSSLQATPEKLTVGQNQLLLTYRDAEGEALANRYIKVNDKQVGETDSQGKFTYYLANASLTLEVQAQTDQANEFTEIEVKKETSSIGNIGLVVTAPTVVTSPQVTIKISNPYDMRDIVVNNQNQNIFIPVKSYTTTLNLNPGNNTIKVDVYDSRYISNSKTLTVFYETKVEPVTLQIGVAGAYGTPTLFLGTTMVPVRFAEDLGAEMSWDNDTKTVTYLRGDKEIKMTIGNSFGYINDQKTDLAMSPYINEHGRVMVPLRMIANELGFKVQWTDKFQPIVISK